jgi:hypothetical protein
MFPTISAGTYFYATLTDSSNNLEIVKVTGRSSDSLTVLRGQEGTTALAYAAGDLIELRITAAVLQNFVQLDGAQTVTGDKTFSGALISSGASTFSGTLSAASGALVLPSSATPAQTAEGSVVWDTDNDLLTVGTGSARKTYVDLDTAQTISNKTFSNSVIDLGANLLNTTSFTFSESGGKLLFVAKPTFTASITSDVMTVTAATVGQVNYGAVLTGTGVTGGTTIGAQLTSTETASAAPAYASGGAIGDTLVVVASATGIAAGQMVSGTGVPAGTYVSLLYDGTTTIPLVDRTGASVALTIQAAGTYTFAAPSAKGTYSVSAVQTVASTTLTGTKTVASLGYNGTLTVAGNVVSNGTP